MDLVDLSRLVGWNGFRTVPESGVSVFVLVGLGPGGMLGGSSCGHCKKWEFPKIGDPYFGVLIIGILPFRVLY